jgi:hypothetical protein
VFVSKIFAKILCLEMISSKNLTRKEVFVTETKHNGNDRSRQGLTNTSISIRDEVLDNPYKGIIPNSLSFSDVVKIIGLLIGSASGYWPRIFVQ